MGVVIADLGQDQGFLKCILRGWEKSGKTRTAAGFAVGVKQFFALKGPVYFFDTEKGSGYLSQFFKDRKVKVRVARSRSFDDLMEFAHLAEAEKSILIVDSISHVAEEINESYLRSVNESRKNRGLNPRTRLEFQDWAGIKAIFDRWTKWYLNSPVHVIVCGRAAWEWGFEVNEETGKKELHKEGIKVSRASAFGYEAGLLIEMSREQVLTDGAYRLKRKATVLGDRFGVIDGAEVSDPTFDFISPHVKLLRPDADRPVEMEPKTEIKVDDSGDAEWAAERKTRAIIAEEIQGLLVESLPGQSAAEKRSKAEAIFEALGTRSWTAVENMPSEKLRVGLKILPAIIADQKLKMRELAAKG